MPLIYPSLKRGADGELARLLLLFADDPRDVKTTTDNGFAFDVPDYIHAKYVASREPAPEDMTPAMVDQAKRRPGRPRKADSVDKEGD